MNTQEKTDEFIGKTFKRSGRLPVLVVGYDASSCKYQTKQVWRDSQSVAWLKKNLPKAKLEVGRLIKMPEGKSYEIQQVDDLGCRLVHPEIIPFTAQELIELDADHQLGDRLNAELKAPTHFRSGHNFAWRSQGARR